MKKVLLVIIILQMSLSCFGQEKTKVLLIGTYHFGGNTPDKHKVSGDLILSDKKQKELNDLLGRIEKFKPQRIYVENEIDMQSRWDSLYMEHKKGIDLPIENEIYQVGVKLASRLNLKEGVTCVDWQVVPARTYAEKEYFALLEKIVSYHEDNNIPYDTENLEHTRQIINNATAFNERIPQMNLVDVFRYLNSDSFVNNTFYSNRLALLETDEHSLMAFWSQNMMTRELKIYQNIIQDILKNKPQRVMILYGAAHMKAMKNFLEVHPGIEVVEVSKYLK
jgi:hypothetical protein